MGTKQAEEMRGLVLRELVLRHLAGHPGAADTLEGIAGWWIMREQLRADLHLLTRDLDDLTREQILQATDEGNRRVYRLRSP